MNATAIHDAMRIVEEALNVAVEPRHHTECVLALFLLELVSERARDPRNGGKVVLPRSADFQWLLEMRKHPGNADRIHTAFSELEKTNPELFAGFFADARFNPRGELENKALARALKVVGAISLKMDVLDRGRAVDILAPLEENLTWSAPSSAEERPTPTDLSYLMARLADPRPGDRIYDPVCGSASLLLSSALLIHERTNSRDYQLWGQDISPRACTLAKLRSFLNCEDRLQVVCGDTLREPQFPSREGAFDRFFDVILANPPFSLPHWGWEKAERDAWLRFGRGVPPRGRADYAFILHMIESMNPKTGRAVTTATHGVLFRGETEAAIRQRLVEDNLLDAVIGLPPKLHYRSAIPTVLLCFQANRSDDHVLFIDAGRDYPRGKRNQLRTEDIERIVDTYRARTSIPDYAALVTRDQIAAKDFNLSLNHYVLTSAEQGEPGLDQQALRERVQELRAELSQVGDELERKLEALPK